MKPEDFKKILAGAISGSHFDFEKLLELYRPMIEHNSYLYGQFDEDLNQYILMHIALNISKFKI